MAHVVGGVVLGWVLLHPPMEVWDYFGRDRPGAPRKIQCHWRTFTSRPIEEWGKVGWHATQEECEQARAEGVEEAQRLYRDEVFREKMLNDDCNYTYARWVARMAARCVEEKPPTAPDSP